MTDINLENFRVLSQSQTEWGPIQKRVVASSPWRSHAATMWESGFQTCVSKVPRHWNIFAIPEFRILAL
ncbi:hypothetical protein NQ317_004554 [Molorchus minor]|uniref:Uncharacterized protein n=1 Tax=Molorchus minor TaxID=1323400 RepID=A0ABQ9J1K4_9CUCU|nr:hypothetical protein NQ317_004554 [Molorchus minor]